MFHYYYYIFHILIVQTSNKYHNKCIAQTLPSCEADEKQLAYCLMLSLFLVPCWTVVGRLLFVHGNLGVV